MKISEKEVFDDQQSEFAISAGVDGAKEPIRGKRCQEV